VSRYLVRKEPVMPRLLSFGVVVILLLTPCLLPAACTPLGDGDDTGCVPPDKTTAKCENGVASALVMLTAQLAKCNIRDGDAKWKATNGGASCVADDPSFDGPSCQIKARTTYDDKVAKLVSCPPCLSLSGARDVMTQLVNSHNDLAYCSPSSGCAEDIGQPVQNVSGDIPDLTDVKQCEDREARALSKLMGAILKCHVSSAKAQERGKSVDEEACETTAESKYDATTAKLGICTGCLGFGGYAAARDLTHSLIDAQSVNFYCASPSGAFLN
jgi:hypothetical protein